MKKSKLEKCIRTADLGDNAASMFVNYGVAKKKEGKYSLFRILMLCAYALFVIGFAGFFIAMNILPIIAIVPVLTYILVLATWRFVSIEYEYYILDGEFRMLKLYGSKSMRELCRVRVSAMKTIAPYSGEYKVAADEVKIQNRIESVSSMDAPDVYYAIFEDGGEECVVFFEVIEKTLKALKYYNSEVIAGKTTH